MLLAVVRAVDFVLILGGPFGVFPFFFTSQGLSALSFLSSSRSLHRSGQDWPQVPCRGDGGLEERRNGEGWGDGRRRHDPC